MAGKPLDPQFESWRQTLLSRFMLPVVSQSASSSSQGDSSKVDKKRPDAVHTDKLQQVPKEFKEQRKRQEQKA